MKTFPQFPEAWAHNLAWRETENACSHYLARARCAPLPGATENRKAAKPGRARARVL